MIEIFGIISILFIIIKKSKLFVKETIYDVKTAENAIQKEDIVYQGFDGKLRLIGSNEQVVFRIDPVSGDAGYLIIKPGKNYHKFINIDDIRRNNAWIRAHEKYLKSGFSDGDPTVIEYESIGSKLDERSFSYYEEGEGLRKVVPRECIGRRFRDIATGRMLVKRNIKNENGVDCYFYMDAETGEILRGVEPEDEMSSISYKLNLNWITKVVESEREKHQNRIKRDSKIDYQNYRAYSTWGTRL